MKTKVYASIERDTVPDRLCVMTRCYPTRALFLVWNDLMVIGHALWRQHEVCVKISDAEDRKLFCECGYGNFGRSTLGELRQIRRRIRLRS